MPVYFDKLQVSNIDYYNDGLYSTKNPIFCNQWIPPNTWLSARMAILYKSIVVLVLITVLWYCALNWKILRWFCIQLLWLSFKAIWMLCWSIPCKISLSTFLEVNKNFFNQLYSPNPSFKDIQFIYFFSDLHSLCFIQGIYFTNFASLLDNFEKPPQRHSATMPNRKNKTFVMLNSLTMSFQGLRLIMVTAELPLILNSWTRQWPKISRYFHFTLFHYKNIKI